MNKQQFDAFLTRSQDLWALVETYRLAYVTSSEALNRRAESLKWITLISGFVTGLCSIPLFLNIPATEYIVAVFGTLTGSLTLMDKYFRWEERSSETWRRHKALENIQKDLYHYALDTDGSASFEDTSLFHQQLSDKSSDETSLRIESIDQWKQQASQALQNHGISNIKFRHPAKASEKDEEFLTDDAEGIIEVTRGTA